jgi:hypothetical protein
MGAPTWRFLIAPTWRFPITQHRITATEAGNIVVFERQAAERLNVGNSIGIATSCLLSTSKAKVFDRLQIEGATHLRLQARLSTGDGTWAFSCLHNLHLF